MALEHLPLLLAPSKDTGTAASLRAASDTPLCFNCCVWHSLSSADFPIICCLQVHLVNSGRWCGLVGSPLASVGEHLGPQLVQGESVASGPSKGDGKIHLCLRHSKYQQLNMTLQAEVSQ